MAGDIPVEQAETLRTIAEVATAFAGFSGVVVALGSRADREWSYNATMGIRFLLAFSLGVVFFAFVPLIVEAIGVPVWRISNGLFGSFHLVLFVWVVGRSAPQIRDLLVPPWLFFVAAGIGAVSIALKLFVAVGLFQPLACFTYLVGLVWLLTMATMMFVYLISEFFRGAEEPSSLAR